MRSGLPHKILIIDDDPMDRDLYRHCLRQSPGCNSNLKEAGSVAAGVEKAMASRPDCILLDFNLPDMDGIEAIRRIGGELGELPSAVIMLTAFGGEELAVRAMKAGAMDYLAEGKFGARNSGSRRHWRHRAASDASAN